MRQRQHYIALLERIVAAAFRMFRNQTSTTTTFAAKLSPLLKKTADYTWVVLNGEYHRKMREYCDFLTQVITNKRDIDTIRDEQMTALNRIQKLKNTTKYKKPKHKTIHNE